MILWDVFKVIIISAKSLLAEEIGKVTVQNSLNCYEKICSYFNAQCSKWFNVCKNCLISNKVKLKTLSQWYIPRLSLLVDVYWTLINISETVTL